MISRYSILFTFLCFLISLDSKALAREEQEDVLTFNVVTTSGDKDQSYVLLEKRLSIENQLYEIDVVQVFSDGTSTCLFEDAIISEGPFIHRDGSIGYTSWRRDDPVLKVIDIRINDAGLYSAKFQELNIGNRTVGMISTFGDSWYLIRNIKKEIKSIEKDLAGNIIGQVDLEEIPLADTALLFSPLHGTIIAERVLTGAHLLNVDMNTKSIVRPKSFPYVIQNDVTGQYDLLDKISFVEEANIRFSPAAWVNGKIKDRDVFQVVEWFSANGTEYAIVTMETKYFREFFDTNSLRISELALLSSKGDFIKIGVQWYIDGEIVSSKIQVPENVNAAAGFRIKQYAKTSTEKW